MNEVQPRSARPSRRATRPFASRPRRASILWRTLLTPAVAGSIIFAAAGTSALPGVPVSSPSFLYPTFGTNGEALLTAGGSGATTAQAQAVAGVPTCPSSGTCHFSGIQNDVVAAGYEGTTAGGTNLAVVVVNPTTGKPVTSFGNGLVTDNLGEPQGSTVQATGVAVYPACPSNNAFCPWANETGDVVVVTTATAATTGQADIVVVQYNPAGTRLWKDDITPASSVDVGSPAIALETRGVSPTGDIIVAGSVFPTTGGTEEPVLAALQPSVSSPSLDSNFGAPTFAGEEVGFVEPVAGTAPLSESLTGVAIDSAGNVVTAGTWSDASGESVVAARFNSAGSPDSSFGGAGCASTPSCTGARLVTPSSGNLGPSATLAIEPTSGTCTGEPSCYNVLVAGTFSPSSGNSVGSVAALNQAGGIAFGFGGGLVTLPAASTNAQGTGIAVQAVGSTVTGVMLSGYQAGSGSNNGKATVSRLTGSGGLVTSFGSGGTYVLPARSGSPILPDPKTFAVSTIPKSLDFMAAGALLTGTDTVTRFALARVVGEVLTLSAKVTRDTAHPTTDFVTITLTSPANVPASIGVKYTLTGTGGLTFGPPSGTITVAAGTKTRSATAVVYFPPLVGNQTITVSTSNASGLTALTSPTSFKVAAASPLGTQGAGYWQTDSIGQVYAFGAPGHGGLPSAPTFPIVGVAESANGSGYWMTTSAGTVHAFGVPFKGGLTSKPPSPIVAIASDAYTGGYWLFAANGHVYGFGAPVYGQPRPASPIVSASAAPNGLGYVMVTKNGVVYAYGPGATYHGGHARPGDVVCIATDLRTGGYWILTSNGALFALGAPYLGAPTGQHTTSITGDPLANGYWITNSAGGVFSYGAKFLGEASKFKPKSAVISILGR